MQIQCVHQIPGIRGETDLLHLVWPQLLWVSWHYSSWWVVTSSSLCSWTGTPDSWAGMGQCSQAACLPWTKRGARNGFLPGLQAQHAHCLPSLLTWPWAWGRGRNMVAHPCLLETEEAAHPRHLLKRDQGRTKHPGSLQGIRRSVVVFARWS